MSCEFCKMKDRLEEFFPPVLPKENAIYAVISGAIATYVASILVNQLAFQNGFCEEHAEMFRTMLHKVG